MGKEPRATQQAQVGRLLHRAAFALLALHFCYIVLLRGGGDGRDTGGAPQERAAAAARGGGRGRAVGQGSLAPFGVASVPGSSAAESSRRPLDPHEMCSWETAQDASTFDAIVDREGWPTSYEQTIAEKRGLRHVTCPVCGALGVIRFDGHDLREEGTCHRCGSFNRVRQVAHVALEEAGRLTGRRFNDLHELVAAHTSLRIYNTQCDGMLHDALKAAAGYVCSEFIDAELAPGAVREGVRHEDLQRTTFPDGSFDLILSSETLATVPSPYQALFELKRVLWPGGALIFTAPFSPSDYHDQVRAAVEDGKLSLKMQPPIYAPTPRHPDGVLLFTIFGREAADKLCMLGFNATVHHLHVGLRGIIGDNAWVFAAVKPTAAAAAGGRG